MSADIDRLGICAQDVHELYAGTLEVALCIWLLYVYIGVGAAAAAGFNARKLSPNQRFSGIENCSLQISMSSSKLPHCDCRRQGSGALVGRY